ncbi:MAG: hypothetical protein COV57_00585 [Candidatus Liptonbacteria bacterium CG11_big_fil_rev_8_21_14_0_20_35_14]|uniref:Uncharacterized protein n=1 Tax=Candidatus Liptonbacteria bacterium CG11_big_fil_rev_8_21_14_0_20_35_14 TaxID=1974634 RepID=A0A2H0N8E7_9BACT|nr:MAG: hypothetical protein COV57_00585 [Candidatus Liptonbacteria bacterium CG11_big_fil_rev_8_21_14_0_20_35_14]
MDRAELEKEKEDLVKQISELEGKVVDYGDDHDVDGGDTESHESESLATNQGIVKVFRDRLDEIERELNQ